MKKSRYGEEQIVRMPNANRRRLPRVTARVNKASTTGATDSKIAAAVK